MLRTQPTSTLFPYTTLFRSGQRHALWEPLLQINSFVSIELQHKRPGKQRAKTFGWARARSEEHTSELQSRGHLVCRLLLEKKKQLILMFFCFSHLFNIGS